MHSWGGATMHATMHATVHVTMHARVPATTHAQCMQQCLQDGEQRARAVRSWAILGGSGVCLALHFGCWVWGLEHTSITHSLLFVCCVPILIAGGLFVLRKPISRVSVLRVRVHVFLCVSVCVSVSACTGPYHGPVYGDQVFLFVLQKPMSRASVSVCVSVCQPAQAYITGQHMVTSRYSHLSPAEQNVCLLAPWPCPWRCLFFPFTGQCAHT
jgi:hypothetical protein